MFDANNDFAEAESESAEQKRIARRCAYLYESFEAYNRKLSATGLHGAEMNKALLLHAVESYFLDIRRLKTFHGMERADRYKIAGYFLKWISKIKPIQIGRLGSLSPDLQKRGILVNADFALIHALTVANIDQARVNSRLLISLLYSAHYRALDGGVMAVALESLAKAYPRLPLVAGRTLTGCSPTN